jgi:TolB-like protein/class 3 adenylate cyclase
VAPEREERRLAAILAADMVGYSRLMEADEMGTIERQKAHRKELINPKLGEHNGRIFKTMGDGLLVEFASVVDAVQSAVTIQRAMEEREADVPEDRRIRYRVGINTGDIVIDSDDILGDSVNVAARLEGLAKPGGICIPRKVFHEVRNKLDVGYEFIGEQKVKNIETPVPVYRVLLAPAVVGQVIGESRLSLPRWRLGTVAAGALALAAAVVAAVWWRPWTPDVEPARLEHMAFPLPEKPSIAVLPFENTSGNPEQDYFAEGLTSDLITDLSNVSGLFVIAMNSTATYTDSPVNIGQVAEELGVRFILEGSVRHEGEAVRINTQLIDAMTGSHQWAERYDGNLADVFSLQDEISKKVVSALAVKLKPGESYRLDEKYGISPQSNRLFLNAKTLLSTYATDLDHLLIPRQLFERVIEQAHDFPGGYAGLSRTYSIAVMGGYSPAPAEDAKEALRWARKAWEIDEQFEMTQVAMASALHSAGQTNKAIVILDKILMSAPSHADAHALLGIFRMWAGQAEKAIGPINSAIRLNPKFASPYRMYLGMANFTLGKYEAVVATLEENSIRGGPINDAGLAVWAAAYNELARSDKAAKVSGRLLDRYPDFHLRSFWMLRQFVRPKDRNRLAEIFERADLPINRPYTR